MELLKKKKKRKLKRPKSEPRPPEYNAWAKAVKQRDNYTCRKCGCTDKKRLHSHHIKSWSIYVELRYDINNGLTLCIECHIDEHPELQALMMGKKRKKAKKINKRLKILRKASSKKLISY